MLQIPNFCRNQLIETKQVFVHVIHLTPKFGLAKSHTTNTAAMHDIYTSNLCYGLITANPLPEICNFPIYVSAGEIEVNFKVNQNTITLTYEQIIKIRRFHVFVFSEVLRILQSFLMLDNSADAPMMLLVPLLRNSCEIIFDIIEQHERLEPVEEPNRNAKASLVVTADEYLGRIVTPWYRPQETVNIFFFKYIYVRFDFIVTH